MELKVVVNVKKNYFLALLRSSEVNGTGSQIEKRESRKEHKLVRF